METEPTKITEWFNNLTVSGFINLLLLVSFTIIIIIFVARTFREDSNA